MSKESARRDFDNKKQSGASGQTGNGTSPVHNGERESTPPNNKTKGGKDTDRKPVPSRFGSRPVKVPGSDRTARSADGARKVPGRFGSTAKPAAPAPTAASMTVVEGTGTAVKDILEPFRPPYARGDTTFPEGFKPTGNTAYDAMAAGIWADAQAPLREQLTAVNAELSELQGRYESLDTVNRANAAKAEQVPGLQKALAEANHRANDTGNAMGVLGKAEKTASVLQFVIEILVEEGLIKTEDNGVDFKLTEVDGVEYLLLTKADIQTIYQQANGEEAELGADGESAEE